MVLRVTVGLGSGKTCHIIEPSCRGGGSGVLSGLGGWLGLGRAICGYSRWSIIHKNGRVRVGVSIRVMGRVRVRYVHFSRHAECAQG